MDPKPKKVISQGPTAVKHERVIDRDREQRSGIPRHQEVNLLSKGSSVQMEYNLFDDP